MKHGCNYVGTLTMKKPRSCEAGKPGSRKTVFEERQKPKCPQYPTSHKATKAKNRVAKIANAKKATENLRAHAEKQLVTSTRRLLESHSAVVVLVYLSKTDT